MDIALGMKPTRKRSRPASLQKNPEIENTKQDSNKKETKLNFLTTIDLISDSIGTTVESKDNEDISYFLPDCWTMKQYKDFKKKYDGLIVKRKRLGCVFCSKFDSLRIKRVHVSVEWGSCSVGPAGKNKVVKQASLRKKMKAHFTSKAHKICVKRLQDRIKDSVTRSDSLGEAHPTAASNLVNFEISPFGTGIEVQNRNISEVGAGFNSRKLLIASTCRVFNTVYSLSKRNGSFSNFTKEIDLQVKNGADVNLEFSSQETALKIADHIANEIKQKVISKIIEQKLKICVIIHEILTISTKPVLSVFLKVEDCDFAPTIFLDLVELLGQEPDSIYIALLKCLHDAGFDEEFLKKNLIALCSNGASEMVGRHSSLICRLKTHFPNVLVWHCLSHALRLSLDDSMNNIQQVNYLKVFLEKLTTIVQQSNKIQLQLFNISNELEREILNIGRVLGLRWAAGSLNIALAVWNTYPALYKYFVTVEKNADIAGIICNKHFLDDLALMIDILQEIHSLSTALQANNLSMFKAESLIKASIKSFEMLWQSKGMFEKKVDEVVASAVFGEVKFTKDPKFSCIPRQKLLEAVIENMQKQLMHHTDDETQANYKQENDRYIYKLLNLFEPDSWTVEDVVSPGQAAEEKLNDFNKIFGHDISIEEFRNYVDNVVEYVHMGKKFPIPSSIQKVKNIINTISIDSEALEKALSTMNAIYLDKESHLAVSNVASLMSINLNGLPLESWNATDSVSNWIRKQPAPGKKKLVRNSSSDNDNQVAIWKFFK